MNKLNDTSSKKITDYIVPLTNVFLMQNILAYLRTFNIYKFEIDGIPYYIPIGKMLHGPVNYLIVYKCELSSIPQLKVTYDSIFEQLESWSSTNNFKLIYHTYNQPVSLTIKYISLLTLIIAFESLTNYIVINKKLNNESEIELTSVTTNPPNIPNLLAYYYSVLLQFEKIAYYVDQHRREKPSVTESPTKTKSIRSPIKSALPSTPRTPRTHRTSRTRKSVKGNQNLWSESNDSDKLRKPKPKPKQVLTPHLSSRSVKSKARNIKPTPAPKPLEQETRV